MNRFVNKINSAFVKKTEFIKFIIGHFVLMFLVVPILTSCSGSKSGALRSTVGGKDALTVTPLTKTVSLGGTLALKASGGSGNYNFDIYYGNGTLTSSGDTGSYQAPLTEGTAVIRVQDSDTGIGYATIEISDVPVLQPSSKTLSVGNKFPFSVIRGKAPYTFSVVSGAGTINSTTGEFTAASTTGNVVVRVTDASGRTADANITVNSSLSFTNKTVYVQKESTTTLSVTGGVPPYRFAIASGLGAVDPATGVFTAPSGLGASGVYVFDAASNVDLAIVNTTSTLQISPSNILVAKNGTLVFSAIGGVPPYQFSVKQGTGTIGTLTGLYVAPGSSTSEIIEVTDGNGITSDANVTVTDNLSFSVETIALAVGNTVDISSFVTGGVQPLNYSAQSSQGTFSGTHYTAPNVPGVYTVTVNDSSTPTPYAVTTKIMVNSALTLLPSTAAVSVNGKKSFSASGGVPPYTYGMSSGGGAISTTGVYSAPATNGSAVVLVTDARGNTATANVTIQDTLTIAPTTKTLNSGEVFTFTASGGSGNYQFSLTSGAGGIDPSTGAYTAPASAGTATVSVSDGTNHQEALISILNPLYLSPPAISMAKGSSVTFTASGGSGQYIYSVASGDGSINSSGVFVAPSAAGTSTVRVTDRLFPAVIKDAQVTIYDGLSISPFTKTLAINQTFTFTATGGVSPYTYSLTSGVGTIARDTGAYSSSVDGAAVVRVTDAKGNFSEATITVNSALTIVPTTKTLGVNNSFTFNATGGVPPYKFTVSGSGTISSNGDYKAPATSATDIVTVTDSGSTPSTASATVTVNNPLTISPPNSTVAAGGTQTFIAAGGVGNYTYSVLSGGGSFSGATFTAPSVATGASVTVQVADPMGNTASASVTVSPITVAITSPNSSDLVTASNKAAFPVSGTCTESGRTVTVAATGGIVGSPSCSGGAWSTTLNLSSVADGSVTITANHSNVNNVSAAQASVTLSKDGSNPTIAITAPTASSYVGGSVTVTGSCTKAGPVNITVTGGVSGVGTCDGTSYSSTLNITPSPEGAITIGVTHTDNSGNTSSTTTVSVIKDTLAPVISAFAVTNSSPTNSTTYNLTSTVVEASSIAYYCILENSTTVANCTWQSGALPSTFVVSSTNNAKVLTAWVKDLAGNVSAAANSNSVTLDTVVPDAPTTLALSTPTSSPGHIATPAILVSGVVVGDTVKIFTDSACLDANLKGTATVSSGTTVTVTSSTLTAASYTFYAKRTTAVGNSSNCSTASLAYVLDLTVPTITNVTSTTANGTYGAGSNINVQVVFSESVSVTGTPTVALATGRGGAVATYVSGNNSNTFNFTYTVTTGDNAADLDYSSTSALSLGGGGAIADLAGNALASTALANPGAAGSLGANKNIVLNTTPGAAPTTLTLVTPASSPSINQTPTISVAGVTNGDTVKLFTDSSCTTLKATGTASGNTIQLTSSSLSEGSYTFYANRTDTVGNVSNCSASNVAYVVDLTAPSISNISSSTTDGSYKAGASISIQVQFGEVVNVTGVPQLSMATGRSGAAATYASGSGTNTLTFTFSVASGDNSSHLDYSSTGALSIPTGASISDVAGNVLTVPLLPSPGNPGSLSANKNLAVDTTPPTAPSGLALNTPATSPGSVATPVVQVSGVVSGDTVKLFTDSSCATTAKASAVATGTTILLTSSTLTTATYTFYANSTDPAGNVSSCSTANVSYQLDTTPPAVTTVTSTDGYYKAGASFNISITFSKIVNVTGTPVLALNTGRTGAQATYSSGSGNSTLVFSYTVVSPDTSSDLTYTATNSLSLNGGTIKDAAGNNATLTLPTIGAAGSLSYNQAVVLDTTAPSSASISINSGASYTTSTSVTLTLSAVGADSMYVTNISGCGSGGTYENYAVSKAWTLQTTNASNTVYVKYKDLAGNESACVNASIIHDTIAPNAPTGLSLGSVPNGNTSTPTLTWTAGTDSGSGVAYHQVEVYKASDNSIVSGCSWTTLTSGSAMTCSAGAIANSTQYYMKVRAVDNAGNIGTAATSSNWTSLAGQFVAVAYNYNAVAKSVDGITWSSATMPSTTTWHSVAFGNGKYVATALSGVAAYSTDGSTWTSATMPSVSGWISVTYGNGKFVAISTSSAAAYSSDGVTWTAATLPANQNWQLVTYGGTKFVAVAYNYSTAAYSSDGITWTASTLPSASAWSSVAYGGGKFVVVAANSTAAAAYSTDGINWTAATLPNTTTGQSVVYGGGQFVTVGNGSSAAYSTDGVSWTSSTISANASWQAVAYGNGRYVATAWGTNVCSYSTDGITWTACTVPASTYWVTITHD